MTFQTIRAYIETRVEAAYAPARVRVMFQNTFETPPPMPYVVCIISYPSTTEGILCPEESMIENLRGNLQLSIYVDRAKGMGELEDYAATAMKLMNSLHDWTESTKVRVQRINGPEYLLESDEAFALATISGPFLASVD